MTSNFYKHCGDFCTKLYMWNYLVIGVSLLALVCLKPFFVELELFMAIQSMRFFLGEILWGVMMCGIFLSFFFNIIGIIKIKMEDRRERRERWERERDRHEREYRRIMDELHESAERVRRTRRGGWTSD